MKKDKIRMPAEWEPHDSTLICWPHQKEDWPGKFVPIIWVYGEIVRKLSVFEKVRIIIQSSQMNEKVLYVLKKVNANLSNVEFIVQQTDRGWMRDSSPFFVYKNENREAVHFLFNGWAKYDNWKKDKLVPNVISKKINSPLSKILYNGRHVVLEGGAIDINGKGTLITTEECLLHPSVQVRNPGFTKKDYEQIFSEYLGIKNVIWLGNGIAGDDTHGHVDDLCRFVNETTLVICDENNPSDKNYSPLKENIERLQSATLENGSNPEVITLPMPSPLWFDGMQLPASYANFYIANDVVLVPTFNDPNDSTALGILSELFPERFVVGVHAVDLVWGLGTLHCLSHEIPWEIGRAHV